MRNVLSKGAVVDLPPIELDFAMEAFDIVLAM